MRNEVDSLGRFVIPVKYRRKMNLNRGDEIDVMYQKGTLVLKKAYPACIFCDSEEELSHFAERMICRACMEKIKNQADVLYP